MSAARDRALVALARSGKLSEIVRHTAARDAFVVVEPHGDRVGGVAAFDDKRGRHPRITVAFAGHADEAVTFTRAQLRRALG